MVYGQREGCPSDRHGSVRARRKYGCLCSDSREAERERGRRYRAGAAYRVNLARRCARLRQERAFSVEALFRVEREERVRCLTLAGWSATEIAVRIGRTQRSVVRIRAKLRSQGRLPQVDIRTYGELEWQHDRDERSRTEHPDQHDFVPARHHAEG